MHGFLELLRVQRWDDHRYYHHSRINQTLHLISAISFVCAYALLFKNPALAGLIAWLVAMTTRQMGHFFFEPKGYDEVNQATYEYKEEIKVGYNIHRKIVLMTIWALSPVVLLADPSLLGFVTPSDTWDGFFQNLGYMWLLLGAGGLLFRTVQLFFISDLLTGLCWATKIITDPFHDIKLYHRAPSYLLHGQLFDTSIAEDEPREAEL
jgi:hypothetical protein